MPRRFCEVMEMALRVRLVLVVMVAEEEANRKADSYTSYPCFDNYHM